MTTEQQIEKQLNDEFVKFSNGNYSGKVEVPKDIIEMFKKGVMVIPPFAHKINFTKVKTIASKKVDELSYADLNDVIRVVLNTSLELRYGNDFDEAVKQSIKFDKFVLCFNEVINDFQGKLKMKKTNLLNLSAKPSGRLQLIN